MFSMTKVKALHQSAQVQHIYETSLLLLKQLKYRDTVFNYILKHQLTRDNTLALIRSCGNEVFKVEKSKADT